MDKEKKVTRNDKSGNKNKSSKSKKTVNKKKEKATKILAVIGYVLCGILMVTAIVAAVTVNKLNILPKLLLVLLTMLAIMFAAIFAITQRWFGIGIFTKIVSIVMIVILTMATSYVSITHNALSKMTGVTTQITNIHVYVMKEDPAVDLEDTKDYPYGILQVLDRENTDQVLGDINRQLGTTLNLTEYNNVADMATALYDGQVKAIVLNSAYISILAEIQGFEDFESRIRSVSASEIVEEIEVQEEPVEEYTGEEVITLYISGVDSTGVPEINSNSDVNIILTANLKTRQVLIISTPRDFYVPLSISGDYKDKLTHAGGYGIDVSVDTLAMLYDVEVDDYIKVNFTGFIEIVDALGGVDVYSEFDFSTLKEDGTYYNYHKGYNKLNGEEALAFARNRNAFSDGDRQRGKNQMAVIEAVINKMATSDMLKNYDEVLNAVSSSMITSMSYEEISNLIKFQLNDMRGWEVLKYSVNGFDSGNTTYSGGSQVLYVMEPDMATVEQAREYIDQMYEGKKITIK